jgi:hypothetical protein
VKSLTGRYFVRKKQTQVRHKDVTDENAAWLWKRSMEILNPYLSR